MHDVLYAAAASACCLLIWQKDEYYVIVAGREGEESVSTNIPLRFTERSLTAASLPAFNKKKVCTLECT